MKAQFHLALPVTIPLVAALVLPLGSCNVTSGAAAGALIGAGLGQLAGGDTEATLAGAAAGALIGGAIGYNVEKKREARVLASREATRAELEAANEASSTVPASSRELAIARAKAYEAEHASEYQNPAPKRVVPVSSVLTQASGAESQAATTGPDSTDGFAQNEGSGSDMVKPQTSQETETAGETSLPDSISETPVETTVETRTEVEPEVPIADVTPDEVVPTEQPTEPAAADIEPTPLLVEAVRLPDGGIVLKDLETGAFIDNEVHVVDDIRDVSSGADRPLRADESDEPEPFTLILKDKKTNQTREYTAIYSA